jgi:hypothetical protein
MSNLWKGEAFVVRQGFEAMLCNHENEDAWIPYSQIHDDSELWNKSAAGESGELVIPLWLAVKNGWA